MESSVLQRDYFILRFLPCFMDVMIFLFSSLGGTKLSKKEQKIEDINKSRCIILFIQDFSLGSYLSQLSFEYINHSLDELYDLLSYTSADLRSIPSS